ncbi:LysE family translocator [Celeribacter sp.]|uniref:LysE family translocator n=1 Tax=Celeribacter sp. TaxID=1890673 RepID=UPI003A918A54
MDLHDWMIFFATVLGVSFIPGPSTLVAFAHGANYGWGRSAYTAFGNCTASILQAAAASAGLGLVIASSAVLFAAIKYVGAAYLVYTGIRMWRSAADQMSLQPADREPRATPRKLFAEGFTVALSNPKAIAFFTALFPQFLSSTGNSWAELSTMVGLVGLGAFAVAWSYGGLGAWVHGLQLSKAFMSRLYKTTGGLFVASGIGLAVSRN